jgi:4-hydroxybutyrate CoA-transferase
MYNAKKRSPEEALSIIKNGDRVFTGGNPVILHQALFDMREQLSNVTVYSQFGLQGLSGKLALDPEMVGHVNFVCTCLATSSVRNPWPTENFDQIPMNFSEVDRMVERIKPEAVFLCGSPMDDEGFINLGSNHGCGRVAVDVGAKVIVQVDENMLSVNTDYYKVHISEVDMLCEIPNPKEGGGMEPRPLAEIDQQIAGFITERVLDGSTIQLGAGSVTNAMGYFLKDHKNLGIHAETILGSLVPLIESGVVNNSQKPLLRGVSVAGFAGFVPLYHDNPEVMFRKLSWVNHPDTVSQIPNMVSVNSCLGVDLRGQVCAESINFSNFGGIGGQLDFVEGARRAPHGQSFLAMHSSVTTRAGEHLSKITLTLPLGSVVTTPASDAMNIVTEYGVAEIWCKSAKQRALNLINIAHPEFRDQLAFDAKKYGMI